MIEAKSVTKRFEDFTAVDSLSFAIKKGDLGAFLGPNGAGQFTLVQSIKFVMAIALVFVAVASRLFSRTEL